jgi:hypothetical protein
MHASSLIIARITIYITKLLSIIFIFMENVNNYYLSHICEVIMEKSSFFYVQVVVLLYCIKLYKLNK